MRRSALAEPEGVRWMPDTSDGTGVLVLAGSSGRIDEERARVLAELGHVTESIRWFGGPGQPAGPWDVPLETFTRRVEALRRDCDRVVLVGTSFGAEAALAAASRDGRIDGVAAFAPSDVVWAGYADDGRRTSHWTWRGRPIPFVPFDPGFEGEPDDPPRYLPLYEASRRAFPDRVDQAAIAVERIPEVLLVAGGDDQVWPSTLHASRIAERRRMHGLTTTVVTADGAGHRAVLPGEPVVRTGVRMQRGGTEAADRTLGRDAWPVLVRLLAAR